MILNRRETIVLLIGVMIGLGVGYPIMMISPPTSPPTRYDTTITENKVEYNHLYFLYVGYIGTAIDGDVAVQVEFNLTSSTYSNVGVVLVGDQNIQIYSMCFYNNDQETIYEKPLPDINNWYIKQNVDDLLGVIVFYHRQAESVLQISVWVW